MKVQNRPLDELKADPANARRHTEDNLRAIAASLEEFGQQRPAVVRADGTVLAGNGMVEAARRLGWHALAVIVAPAEWSDDQARAFALADNRTAELAGWDEAALLASLDALDGTALLEASGFDATALDDLRAKFEEAAPPPPAQPGGYGQGNNNIKYAPTVADYAERYASKQTRLIAMDYPNEIYLWVVDRLAELRAEFDTDTNAEAFVRLVEKVYGLEAPEWITA